MSLSWIIIMIDYWIIVSCAVCPVVVAVLVAFRDLHWLPVRQRAKLVMTV